MVELLDQLVLELALLEVVDLAEEGFCALTYILNFSFTLR